MKYRKKPLIIEAFKWYYEEDPCAWNCVESRIDHSEKYPQIVYFIRTLQGDMELKPGDYIIKGIKGEFYPCRSDIFELTYEKVEEDKMNKEFFQMIEKYTIECTENSVEIQGYLSIREAFDFLAYYEREGFTCLTPGDKNSCMLLTKHDFIKPSHAEKSHCSEEFLAIDEIMMWKGKCEKLQIKLLDLENLIKSFLPSNLPEDTDDMAAPNQI